MKISSLLVLFIMVMGVVAFSQEKYASEIDSIQTVEIGFIADCQYADKDNNNLRHYRLSEEKLQKCVDTFNSINLEHVFILGDLIDNGFNSYQSVLPILNKLEVPYTSVLGNHDFSVPDSLKTKVPSILGLNKRYFTMIIKDWKFIILDGNDISKYAYPKNSLKYKESVKLYEDYYSELPDYNGAIGKEQIEWLKAELSSSDQIKEKVMIFCHFPVLPNEGHVLWNSREIIDLISNYQCVKAWFNGHNHAGNYASENGIHYVTLKGMVDTPENSFAKIIVDSDKIFLKGFGREQDKILNIRNNQ